jgi:diguanylate cyclase (GGDEF)-like protein
MPEDARTARTPEPPLLRDMSGRLGLVLVGSAVVAVAAYWLLAYIIPDLALRAVLATGLSVGAAGAMLHRNVVRPLVEDRAELHDRYAAALADALTDPLTGLGNHRAFQEELERQVEQAQRYGVPVSLVLLDLDEFKAVNDENGHAAGDRTLADFGRLMLASLRRVDRPFRIGGDEFAILLPHTDAEGAWVVGRRLLASALQPPLRDQGDTAISFSAGVSTLPELASTREQLYSQADAALYAAKRAGRTDVALFDPAHTAAQPVTGAGGAIAEVIARGQLRPVYQPIVDLDGLAVLGHEGLIRPVAPAPFADPAALFRAAAASGHLVALDMTCIDTIVAGAAGLPPEQFLSVNVSPQTIEAPEFSSAALLGILARHGLRPDRLVLELTEREEIADVDRVRSKLEVCRRAGIRLAADDLGAGNSGLRLLSDLRFDILKVDLTLVQRSSPGAPSEAVVSSVVAFAGRTGALVIGEGIEDSAEAARLSALGVRAGQGFFFGRPGPLGLPETLAGFGISGVAAMAGRAAETPAPMAAWRQSIGLPTPVGG